MLTQIGKKQKAHGLLELLTDCHDRIRRMSTLARRLADTTGATSDEVREAASHVRDYFQGSLPLHVEDEEKSLLPRLRGRDPRLDGALAAMQTQHLGHHVLLGRLVTMMDQVAEEPARLEASRAELADVARELEHQFDEHLTLEEGTVFPAITVHLDEQAQAAIIAELRARRGE